MIYSNLGGYLGWKVKGLGRKAFSDWKVTSSDRKVYSNWKVTNFDCKRDSKLEGPIFTRNPTGIFQNFRSSFTQTREQGRPVTNRHRHTYAPGLAGRSKVPCHTVATESRVSGQGTGTEDRSGRVVTAPIKSNLWECPQVGNTTQYLQSSGSCARVLIRRVRRAGCQPLRLENGEW